MQFFEDEMFREKRFVFQVFKHGIETNKKVKKVVKTEDVKKDAKTKRKEALTVAPATTPKEEKKVEKKKVLAESKRAREGAKESAEVKAKRDKLAEVLTPRVGVLFKGKDISLGSDLTEEGMAKKFATALSFDLKQKVRKEELEKTYPELKDPKNVDLFVENFSKLMAKSVRKELFISKPVLEKFKSVEGALEVKVDINDTGEIVVELKPDDKLKKFLEDIPAEIAENDKKVKEVVKKLLAMRSLKDFFDGFDVSYQDVEAFLDGSEKKAKDEIKKVLSENDKDKYLKHMGLDYKEVFNGLKEAAKAKINKAIESKLEVKFDPAAAKEMEKKVNVTFKGTGVVVTLQDGFKEAYSGAKEKLPGKFEDRKKELQSGIFGFFLKGMKDKEINAVIEGKHPLSYFLGAISFVTGGTMFAWALPAWKKARRVLGKNVKFASIVPAIEKAAKSVSGFAGKFEDDPFAAVVDTAVPMSNGGIKKMAKIGGAVGTEGLSFKTDLKLAGPYNSATITVPKKGVVIFPKEMGDIEELDGSRVVDTKNLKEGIYVVKSNTIPKGTVFSSGVKIEFEKKVVAKKDDKKTKKQV